MKSNFKERSIRYREKFVEIQKRAEAAAASGDEPSQRSYENLAKGWIAMVKYAEYRERSAAHGQFLFNEKC